MWRTISWYQPSHTTPASSRTPSGRSVQGAVHHAGQRTDLGRRPGHDPGRGDGELGRRACADRPRPGRRRSAAAPVPRCRRRPSADRHASGTDGGGARVPGAPRRCRARRARRARSPPSSTPPPDDEPPATVVAARRDGGRARRASTRSRGSVGGGATGPGPNPWLGDGGGRGRIAPAAGPAWSGRTPVYSSVPGAPAARVSARTAPSRARRTTPPARRGRCGRRRCTAPPRRACPACIRRRPGPACRAERAIAANVPANCSQYPERRSRKSSIVAVAVTLLDLEAVLELARGTSSAAAAPARSRCEASAVTSVGELARRLGEVVG